MSATFLVVAYGEAGHALPVLSIVEALTRQGHRALVYVSPPFRHGVVAAGGELLEARTFSDPFERMKAWSQGSSEPRHRRVLRMVGGMREARNELVEGAVRMSRELEEVIRTRGVDCVLSGIVGFGARFAAERTGRPFVTVGPNPLMLFDARGQMVLPPHPLLKHVPHRAMHALLDVMVPLTRSRERLGLPARGAAPSEIFSQLVSDTLHLVTVPEDFHPPGPRWPGSLCVGPMSFNLPRPDATPFPVDTLAPGTVLVSTTTLPLAGGFFRHTLEALEPLQVPLLATAAGAADLPERLGAHVRLESFIPHDQVLPHVSALVTHGGWGITGRALRQGVPMLITPLFGDQPLIGARLAELGLAYHLPRKKATPEAFRAALTALRQDTALHERVRAMARKLQAVDSPRLAVAALEEVLQARRGLQQPAA